MPFKALVAEGALCCSWIQDGLWQGFEKRAMAIHMMICLVETELGLCSEGLGAGEDAWVT